MEITLYVNEAEVGPISLEEVQAMLANGELTMEDFAFFEGCSDWVPVADIPGINDAPAEEEAVEEEAAEEEVAPEEPAAEAQEANIYIWPEGAEDWAGPHTLSQVQEQLANEEIAAESFAAFDGSAEGATVADIPGVYDAPVEAVAEEEVAPAPAKKGFGAKKGKGGFSKKGGGGLKKAGGGMKKAGGAAKKGGAAKSAAKTAGKGKVKGAAKKAAAAPVVFADGELSDASFTKVYILACLLGSLGVHRFVTGKVLTGVLMLFTGGGFFIWLLIDIIMILLGNFKDKQGRPVAMAPQEEMSEKKLGTVLLIMHFVPVPGIHRFLTGKIGSGVGFLLTLGGLGIWALLDWIKLAQGKFTDKEGRPILHTLS